MIQDRELKPRNGYQQLMRLLGATAVVIVLMIVAVNKNQGANASSFLTGLIAILALALLVLAVGARGFFALAPGAAAVVTLFGEYQGTVSTPGLYWINPFCVRRPVSLRVRNLNTPTIKVNDLKGNPIEIAMVVVWQVVDAYSSCFEVNDYTDFVNIQSESALRHLASAYPYDAHTEGETSLRGSLDIVSKALAGEVAERLEKAGVKVLDARLSHLAYAPEIAGAMLRRQQAEAIVAARFRIVEGAVGMVEAALEQLEKSKKVTLDDDRRAAMVSNLMVVLCGDHSVQPVVNTGTLYT